MDPKLNFFLNTDFYQQLLKDIPNIEDLNEKELQIYLANNLRKNQKLSNVFLEAKYRYIFHKPVSRDKVKSDSNCKYCKQIKNQSKISEVDIRILDPSAWIEIKIDPNEKGVKKDYDNLFNKNGYKFKNTESLIFITFWKKNGKWFEKEYCTKLHSLHNSKIVGGGGLRGVRIMILYND